MATGDTHAIPAAAAGYWQVMGAFERAAGSDVLTVPQGLLNIGGNGRGYILEAAAGWNPFDAANKDGSFAAPALGDDIYIYAVQQANGRAKLVASKNATVPTGYDQTNSRKIAGLHYGRVRPIDQRYSTAYTPVLQIVPNSLWDLSNRPRCSPEGMVKVSPRLWADIYLNSVISGAWPSVVFGSRYGVAPVRSTGGYNELDLHRGLHAAGKREPSFEEWLMIAYGAPQGGQSDNNTAWSATTNTGPSNTGAVVKSVSCANAVDCVGNLWERLSHHFDHGGTVTWDATVVNTGQESATPRGSVNHAMWRHAVAGGGFSDGSYCGARTLSTGAAPWIAYGHVGVRGVCESI